MAPEPELKDFDFKALKSLPERRSLGEHAYQHLKQAIVSGDLTPESRVIESRLASVLGISRTPVREAVHKLEREGLLRKLPQGSFFVVGFTKEDIEETFGIRSVLESYAARLATIKHHEEELGPLEKKIGEYQMCLDRGEMDALPRINTEFHDLLYALSRSPKLINMINGLRDQIYRFRRIILKMEEIAKVSNDDHKEMLKAMKKRDADRVERLVRGHILRGQRFVLKELENSPGEF